jgi:hypothetical protein
VAVFAANVLRAEKTAVLRTCEYSILEKLRRDYEIAYDMCWCALRRSILFARAGGLSAGAGASSYEIRQFPNDTNHVGGGGPVSGTRPSAAGFFQTAD